MWLDTETGLGDRPLVNLEQYKLYSFSSIYPQNENKVLHKSPHKPISALGERCEPTCGAYGLTLKNAS